MQTRFLYALLIFSFFSCHRSTEYKNYLHNPELFSKTVHELNGVVMGNNFSPVVSSRNYTYAAIAAYEVVAAANPTTYQSLSGQLNGLEKMPTIRPASEYDFQLASLLAYIQVGEAVTFPEGSMVTYKESILKEARQKGMPDNLYNASEEVAGQIAMAIINWSKKDHYLQTRSAEKYTVNEEIPGRWIPTPPAYNQAVEPHWNLIRPMVIDSPSQFPPAPALVFNIKDKTSPYYKQVQMMLDTSAKLTPDQIHMANFWDDNPGKLNVSGHVMFITKKFSPTGHWMSIACLAAKTAHADFSTTVYGVAKTAIAFFDAFIECWDAKYKTNAIRPESVINKYLVLEWHPLLQTPPFPEYTCGHSTISAAAAEALTSVYGAPFSYVDSTENEFGIANRSYTSFRQAAIENTRARFYGGIHFHNSCLEGTKCGSEVGRWVVNKLKMKQTDPIR